MGAIILRRGGFGEAMAAQLSRVVPDEEVVLCDPDKGPPDNAEILLTLLDDPPGVTKLMGPGVRWVHVYGTGVDGFPFEDLGGRILTCSRGAAAVAISEWVLAMMLAFEKRLPDIWIDHPPDRWNLADLGGLSGQTLGVVGLGAIGSAVARRALAFDMKVVSVRRTPRPSTIDGVALVEELEELVAGSDHLVLAAPSTPATHHMIDARALSKAKRGLHLLNVARGDLVDQTALLASLDDGRVARASLDVVDPEPLPAGHPLYSHPSVRLTPHISWSAPGTQRRTFAMFVENIGRFRSGEDLAGQVDVEARY
jgi:phosphoglycerate dehydrogenase-like enzyme